MSCTARNSSLLSALRTLLMFGSDRNGFSPIMNMPRMRPSSAPCMISTTVNPGAGSSAADGVSDGPNGLGRDSADGSDALGRVVQRALAQRLEVLGAIADEITVAQSLGDQDVHDGVVEGDVGAVVDAAIERGEVGD